VCLDEKAKPHLEVNQSLRLIHKAVSQQYNPKVCLCTAPFTGDSFWESTMLAIYKDYLPLKHSAQVVLAKLVPIGQLDQLHFQNPTRTDTVKLTTLLITVCLQIL